MSSRSFRERAWFFSPAIATALFFATHTYFSMSNPRANDNVEAAAADAPVPTNLKIRVVEQIRSLDTKGRVSTAVPTTEAQLLELFHRDGAVVFFSDEVDVVETSERAFDPEVITLRKGTLKR